MNMYIWAIVILNQLFIRDSYKQIEFSKKSSSDKSPLFVIGSFCTPNSVCFNMYKAVLYGNVVLSFVVL